MFTLYLFWIVQIYSHPSRVHKTCMNISFLSMEINYICMYQNDISMHENEILPSEFSWSRIPYMKILSDKVFVS